MSGVSAKDSVLSSMSVSRSTVSAWGGASLGKSGVSKLNSSSNDKPSS